MGSPSVIGCREAQKIARDAFVDGKQFDHPLTEEGLIEAVLTKQDALWEKSKREKWLWQIWLRNCMI